MSKKTIFERLKRRMDMIIESWKNDCRFSSQLAILRLLDDTSSRLGMKGVASFFHKKKDVWILKFLEKKCSKAIRKYSVCGDEGIKSSNAPIWICWWTGEESAPKLVKQCIKSIRSQAGNHEVIFISEENYNQYIDVPDYILEKLKKKQIGLAHFADYVRVCLLEKYGGLWLDTTIFCANKIPEEYFDTPWFTCKSEYQEGKYISCFQWTTFCLGGWKQNVCYEFLKEALETYWQTEETAIDYLFFDYIIRVGYDKIPAMRRYIQQLPENNPCRDDLQAAMNEVLPAESFSQIINDNTILYKLSWREEYEEYTCDGQKSIYSLFLEEVKQ